jgi:hypothetical protein
MQKINKRLILSMAALLIVCGVSLSGSALAEQGSNSGSGSHDSTKTEVTATSSTTSSSGETESETEHSQTIREQFKAEARTKVQSEVKAKVQANTQEQRQKACAARKDSLTKRMGNAVTAAQRHKTNFDNIYTKVQNFYTTKKLNVSNYDTLKAAADKAQQDAADQVSALKALEVNVDCMQTDSLATNLTAFQTAVKSTRDSLKTYRKALVDLITALHGASTSANDSSSNTTTTQ